jgi:hypothetical protein
VRAQIADEPLPSLDDPNMATPEDPALWQLPHPPINAELTDHFLNEGQFYWGAEVIIFDTSWGPSPEDDRIAASRYRLGWEHESGVGVRAQYLTLDHNWNLSNSPFATQIVDAQPGDIYYYGPLYQGSLLLSRKIDNLNLDFYKRLTLGDTELLIGSGVTTVRDILRLQHVFDGDPLSDDYMYEYGDESLKGVGIGLVGELKRPVLVQDTTEVAFLLSGRTSYVPVKGETQSGLLTASMNDKLWIHEAQIGLELLKRLQSFTFILRGQYEIQEWDADIAGNPGFDGVSISGGLGW